MAPTPPKGPMEVAAGGGCCAGTPLLLSDSEQQCYSELFARCAGSASGIPASGHPEATRIASCTTVAAAGPVADLFRASQLPKETLHQITELCGAKRVGYFGPTQFYVALKLIAAAQSGLPVRTESIKCELPLPRFVMSKSDGEIRFGNPAEHHGMKVQIPYLTTEKNSFKRMDDETKQQEKLSPTMSPLASPPSSPPHYQRVSLSHGYSKLRSSTEQMYPASYETRQPIVQPEGPSSEGPGAKPLCRQASLIRSFSVERELQDTSSNYPDEPWRITEEQREYYVNQFRSLQPDAGSFISGSVAKNFFTKSKLSIPELSYIWELSDADCDGALTLPEFCAAFHLIVARKNGYPLPEGLPPTLQAEYLQAAFPKSKWECAIFDSYSELMPAKQQPCDLHQMEKPSVKDKADFPVPTKDVTTGDDKQATNSGLLPPPPALPPRPCPTQSEPVSEADLHPQKNRAPSQTVESSPSKKDAPHAQPPSKPIRRKFRPENKTIKTQEPAAVVGGAAASAAMAKPNPTVQKQSSKQKKAIQTAIRKNKEANAVLARLNSELQQQLKEVHQERMALESQLEQLRPVTVL